MKEIVIQFAETIKAEGGRAMLVGGFVRDTILGISSKDVDIEVYGIEADKLQEIVSRFGKVDAVGASFQVYKLGTDIDVSLPRRERKTGKGHKGFTVEGDPNMSFGEACSRRDFTINAIMQDALTGEIVDPYNGRADLKQGLMRVVSKKSFQEDSLRVLRLVQFASRLNFGIEAKTKELAKKTDLSDLPKERIWMEMEKLLLKSEFPSVGMYQILELGIRDKLFPSLVFDAKTAMALDNIERKLFESVKLRIQLAVLGVDSGAGLFEELGVTPQKIVFDVERILNFKDVRHLPTDYHYHKMSQGVKMRYFAEYLKAVTFSYVSEDTLAIYNDFVSNIERLGISDNSVAPILMGRHLVEMGIDPTKVLFSPILDKIYERQLQGEVTTLDEAKKLVFTG